MPPLALTVAAAVVTVAAARIHDGATAVEPTIARVVGIGIALTGFALATLGVVAFRRARTTVDPRHPEQSARMVTGGVYRWTRNPMYLGFVLVLLGLAIFLQSIPGLAITGAAAACLQRFQIAPEERLLRQRFGAEFEAYRTRVARWL
ncbi:MAG TPA: isoprenylcysteine carboxylmethyltransferase family protein [Burkholderiaceae bacterium]|nr:isoprenylcysteine carboxylmethyltransferase family protein [Burkholderiaceae bacterium]